VLDTAVRELGLALGADRCYYAAYDREADAATIGPEWHRDGLPDLAGRYTTSRYAVNRDFFDNVGHAQVVTDTAGDPATRALGLRALVRVPLVSGGAMTALSMAMTDDTREWRPDEVALMEVVATQTQAALEAVRMRRREHSLAEQFQVALQPPMPASIPGMELSAYYRPAWEDQGVGGDFSDVFAADKGVTYLIVGDMSGKGLAAASSVAMVRHMLRFALYNGRTVSGPLSALNDTLTRNDLLDGFATLFVGRYDAESRDFTYVNCGQDAGLVLRAATGEVEALPPTGPVLGAFSGAAYTEETVRLEAGDVLALYTDGLTEAGPSRTALLTGDGVGTLLREHAGRGRADEIVSRLIAGVDAYAGAGIRDDQCLLVGVVAGPPVHPPS
jgi:serine phosphatase RsbU (regulator of sigma subunit)